MRQQLNKLQRGKSTKAERRFCEILKGCRIPFRAKVRIQNREIDFLIGKIAVEIDGHLQDSEKNKMLVQQGYTPLHLPSWEIKPQNLSWLTKYGLFRDGN